MDRCGLAWLLFHGAVAADILGHAGGHALTLDLLVLLHADGVQAAHRLLLNGGDHLLEHLEGLLFIGDDRVGLGIGAQADALAQILHRVDVIHPVLIHDAQQHDALNLAHDGAGELLLLLLIIVRGGHPQRRAGSTCPRSS